RGLEQTVERLERSGKRVIAFLDVPELPFSPRACIARLGAPKSNCMVSRASVLDRQHDARALMAKLAAAHPRVLVFDPLDFMCDGDTCHVELDDALLYRDSHHLSIRGSERLARLFFGWLAKQPT